MKKVIHRGKRGKTMSEVTPTRNKTKNSQSFLDISHMQKESLLCINCKTKFILGELLLYLSPPTNSNYI